MRKKLVSGLLAATMVASLMVGCGDEATDTTEATNDAGATEATEAETTEAVEDTNEVTEAATMEAPSADGWTEDNKIYLYCWDAATEANYKEVIKNLGDLAEYVEPVNMNVGGTSDEYKTAINEGLADGAEKYASVFLADESIAKNWAETDDTANLNDLGITPEMYANQYQYTVDYGNIDGAQKCLSWQATPGAIIYRSDIAEEVLGSGDPADVAEALKDWDAFFETADKLKEAGYKIVEGPEEIAYAEAATRNTPWVDADSNLVLGNEVTEYMENAKKLADGDYTNLGAQWDADWYGNMGAFGEEADVFCYFGCPWFINTMTEQDVDKDGNIAIDTWRTTSGPVTYYWGGSYAMVGANTPNPELAAYVVYLLTCDEDTMYAQLEAGNDYCINNKAANAKAVENGVGGADIMGGESPVATFAEAATQVKSVTTYADGKVMDGMKNGGKAYYTGEAADVDAAIAICKKEVTDAYEFIVAE